MPRVVTALLVAGSVAACCPNDDPRLNQFGGCECSGGSGLFHTVPNSFCEQGEGTTTVVAGPGVESEDNSRFNPNPISADAWWSGTLENTKDEDWFTISGIDGKASMEIDLENGSTTGEPVLVGLGVGTSLFEEFLVDGGATVTTTVGSELNRAHTIGFVADAPLPYRLRVRFADAAWELEENTSGRPNVLEDGDAIRGRIDDGADDDWYRIDGVDGRRSLAWTVSHRGTAGDEDLVVVAGTGASEREGFTLSAGEVFTLTVGSAFEQPHYLGLSAEAGVVPYQVAAVHGDARYETEPNESGNASTATTAGDPWRGRIRNAADKDWFSIAGPQSATQMSVSVESLDGTASALTVRVLDGNFTEVDTFQVSSGSTGSVSVPSTFEQAHRIELTAAAGPAPYELEVTFTP